MRAVLTATLAIAGLLVFAPLARGDEAAPRIAPSEVLVLGRPGRSGSLAPLGAPDALPLEIARRRGIGAGRSRAVARGPSMGGAFPGGAWVLDLDPGADPIEAARLLAEDPAVLYAGPNHLLAIDGSPETRTSRDPALASRTFSSTRPDTGAADPDDPLFELQYELVLARVPEAWERSLGEGILVAVIDTGVETGHPDLASRIAVNAAEQAGLPGVDDDGNGYVDDVVGYDFTDAPEIPGAGDYLERDPDPADDHGHGTQVAGVIAAERGNGIGIAGVAPAARLVVARAGFRTAIPGISGLLQEDDVAAAVLYAVDRGARILNLSFGDGVDAPVIRAALRYARARGVLVVASAGNTGGDHTHYPGGYPGILAIGAQNREDVRAAFSTYGQDLDLVAPGVAIYTTALGGAYRPASGTSFSAPIVAGVAALLWSIQPAWTADEIAWSLRLSSRREGTGWEPGMGWGRLDAAAAMDAKRPPVIQMESIETSGDPVSVSGTVADAGLVTWSLAVAPESVAVAEGRPGSISGERVLVHGDTRQVVNAALTTYTPPDTDRGTWVIRLSAASRDHGILEERSRFLLPSPVPDLRDLGLDLQAGGAGWDLMLTWFSDDLYQGEVVFAPGTGAERRQQESALVRQHAVRISGPLPQGEWSLRVLGRQTEISPFTIVADTAIVLPSTQRVDEGAVVDLLSPGTPMPHPVDWDGDGVPEVLLEAPPSHDFYGEVQRFEIGPAGEVVPAGTSGGLYHGIPWDSIDSDGDGKQEVVVYRLDGWGVWEAPIPGAFPTVQVLSQSAGTGTPLGFVPVDGGARLLSVQGPTLRSHRSDPVTGYTLEAEVSAPGSAALQARGAHGDFDGDGLPELAIADDAGKLVVFNFSAGGLSWERTVAGPIPITPILLAVPREGATGDDLLTVEQDPDVPENGGDIHRAAIRVRRWRWIDGTPVSVAVLAFAGSFPAREMQLLAGGNGVLLRRGGAFDSILTGDDALAWGGRAWTSTLADVDGGVRVDPAGGPRLLWVGASNPDAFRGEAVALDALDPPELGEPLQTLAAVAGTEGIRVTLFWGSDPCGAPTLTREGTARGTYALAPVGNVAADTVLYGEIVTYTLTTPGCRPRTLGLTGRALAVLAPRWDAGGTLVLDLDLPIENAPLPDAWVRTGPSLLPSRTLLIDREARRLAVASPVPAPDSLILVGGRYRDGYPLGGQKRMSWAVPPPPPVRDPPVLSEVRYRKDASGAALLVTLSGDPPACAAEFHLEPGGLVIPFPETFLAELPLSLPRTLAAGSYRLTLTGPCLAAGPGIAREFSVGILLYPNPARLGDALVLENLEVGTRAQLLDVAGRERLVWRVTAQVDRRDLEGISPGLYFLRLESPDGAFLGVRKLAVLR